MEILLFIIGILLGVGFSSVIFSFHNIRKKNNSNHGSLIIDVGDENRLFLDLTEDDILYLKETTKDDITFTICRVNSRK